MENYERYAGAITVVFSALIIGGLMGANIADGNKVGFIFALLAAFSAWLCAPAVLFYKPGLYRALILIAVLFVIASIVRYL